MAIFPVAPMNLNAVDFLAAVVAGVDGVRRELVDVDLLPFPASSG